MVAFIYIISLTKTPISDATAIVVQMKAEDVFETAAMGRRMHHRRCKDGLFLAWFVCLSALTASWVILVRPNARPQGEFLPRQKDHLPRVKLRRLSQQVSLSEKCSQSIMRRWWGLFHQFQLQDHSETGEKWSYHFRGTRAQLTGATWA